MSVSVTLEGGADLRKALAALSAEVGWAQQRAALKEGAEVIRKEASVLAPRSTLNGEHLADHIVIDQLSQGEVEAAVGMKGHEAVVQVGPSKEFFYGYFLEYGYGPGQRPARAFMRPAFDVTVNEALQKTADQLWLYLQRGTKGTPQDR